VAVGRGAIKVGSGYIEVEPRISRDAMRAMRADLLKQMGAIGTAAGREFSRAAGRGISNLSRVAATEAKRASRAIRQGAAGTDTALRRIERDLTREYGAQATQRFRTFRERELQRRQLVEGTSDATRAALRRTAQSEEAESRAAVRRTETAERERQRLIREREREAIRAERDQARANAQAQRQMREEIARTMRAAQQARRADLQNQLRASNDHAAALRQQLDGYASHIRRLEGDSTSSLGRIQSAWGRQSIHIERLGTTAVEAGNLITRNLVGPLGAVSAALTAIGVASADSLILGQLGLMGAGVSAQDSAAALERIRQYGVETPYSIEAMQSYLARYIRGIISHDPGYRSDDPAEREAAGQRASSRAVDIVQMIGDNAARSGNLDPRMVERAMYAIDMILDMDRVPTRNLRQFVNASGIPVQELALLLGYEDTESSAASAQMLDAMANAAETGGVQGQEFINALLEDWAGPDGARGFASRVGSSTIGGRLQQMREAAQVRLGEMFARQDPETGLYEYTGLGEAIMGRRVEGENGEVSYEGGLLNEATEIGTMALPHAQALLEEFFEVLGIFTDWVRSTAEFLEAHPGLRDAVLQAAKIAALAVPFLVGLGLLTKTFGKLNRLLASGLRPLSGLISGMRGAGRVARQVRAGVQSRRDGGSFREGYRTRRTELRGGDDRGPVRRGLDGLTGRNSQVDRIQAQMRDLERQIQEADERSEELRRTLQQVNDTNFRDLVNQLAGSSSTSVQGSANQAQTSVRQIATQGLDVLNRTRLSQVEGELEQVREKADAVARSVKEAGNQVKALNERRLGSLRSQQLDTTERRARALERAVKHADQAVRNLNGRSLSSVRNEFIQLSPKVSDARKKVADTSTAVSNLNRRSLSSVRGQFNNLHSSVTNVYNKVGMASGSGSLSGRITNLNGRKLTDIRREVDRLKNALDAADGKADSLDAAIGRVNSSTGRGGSGGNNDRRRYASGGVLPGYSPGVDSIPALLSPGEAILRPEVASRLGAATIDAWNAAAVRGRISRYAAGTSGAGRGGPNAALNALQAQRQMFDISTIVDLFGTTVGFGPAAVGIGGGTGRNVWGWGAGAGGSTAGRGAARKFYGIGEYVTSELPDVLRRTPSGLGQILGIIAGAIAPTAGEYFWQDVWKGEGNLAERGARWIGHVLSPDALWEMVQDGVSGIVDSAKAIWDLVSNAVTNPRGVFEEGLAQVREVFTGTVDMVRDTASGLSQIMSNPSEYASDVWTEFYAQAREAMPNTTGLFAFSEGGIVPGYRPGDDTVRALLSPGEAVLRPEAVRHLGYRTVLELNRAAQLGTLAAIPAMNGAVEGLVIAGPDTVRRSGIEAASRSPEIHVHEAKSEDTTQSVLRALQYAETLYGL
jgi:hypothetical protein